MNSAALWLKQKLDLIIVFSAAFILRAAYIYNNSWLAGDSAEYLMLAKNLAVYHVFSFGSNQSGFIPTAFRPPLYPALIALFQWSDAAPPPIVPVLYLQAFLGALTVVLTYQLARRGFNRPTALVSALILTIEPLTIHYTAAIMTETLFTFLLISAFYFWSTKNFVLAGIIFGLATLTRPSLIPFFAVLLLLAVLPKWSAYRKAFLVMTLAAAIVVFGWTIRNYLNFQQIIPITSSGFGMNLLCGTIDVPMLSDEGWAEVKSDTAIRKMRQDLQNGKTEAEVDRELFKEAVQRIISNPVSWLKVRAKQYTRIYIDSAPYLLGHNNVRFEDAIQNRQWFFIAYKLALVARTFILVGLFLIGIFLRRENLTEISHIFLFPIFLMLIHLPLWTENRYLLPMMPFISIMAAYSLSVTFLKILNFSRSSQL